MKILILGAGNMGAWLAESFCLDHEVGIYDPDKSKLKYIFNSQRFLKYEEFEEFKPELVINAVNLQHTVRVFEEVLPYLPSNCILSDIASVKNGLEKFYKETGHRFVSTHPMFGPTFGNVKDLSGQNAVIIEEGDEEGRKFFDEFFRSLKLRVFCYSFKLHDETIAYSLSIPFTSSIVFASVMKDIEVPGTTFKKHLETSRGLLTEDKYLLSEILLNPYTLEQVEKICLKLNSLISLVKDRNTEGIHEYISEIRQNVGVKGPRDS
ncbi:MAG: prephenate dehydrogenase/arogenate dehydrogenase family protein [Bacteroidota bacterium]